MFSAKQENDWTFQSVQSEFHRMLVSGKNIFQSRIALALHSLLSCIFAKSVFSHKVVFLAVQDSSIGDLVTQ